MISTIRTILLTGFMACILATGTRAEDPWWQRETAMGPGGTLRLDDKPWWDDAKNLKVGEQIVLQSQYPDGGMMIVRREKAERSQYGEMTVWILNDGKDWDPNDPQPNLVNDCYVVDYNSTGVVDRILDFMDNTGNGVPDEMDIRYFTDGELRFSWKAFDNDGDGHMWWWSDYEYRFPGFWWADIYGDSLIYLNKYDPENNAWAPFSECPFAFIDIDGNGFSNRSIRFSAVPRDYLVNPGHPDYANSYALISGPFLDVMRDMGILNVRYSFDIDGLAGAETPLHHEMSFNMIGDMPYDYPTMNHHNPLRRHPQQTVTVPLEDVVEVCDTYPADETGFSFMEYRDNSISIGHPDYNPADNRRWEGVFWDWERRLMHNSGGPTQVWNIRREFLPEFRDHRQVYYSPVDRRLHLKSAPEGWIRIGMIENNEPHGEIQMFDTTGDGYFDRWERYEYGNPLPVRVDHVGDADNIDFGDDWAAIQEFYVNEAIPEALRLNRLLIDTISQFEGDYVAQVPANLQAALDRTDLSPTERRYILDLVRHHLYTHLRRTVLADEWPKIEARQRQSGTTGAVNQATVEAWNIMTQMNRIDVHYGAGRYEEAVLLLRRLAPDLGVELKTGVTPARANLHR